MERFGIVADRYCRPPLDPVFYPMEQFCRAFLATADGACRRTLETDYPERTVDLHLADDTTRRLGRAVAAASLPVIG